MGRAHDHDIDVAPAEHAVCVGLDGAIEIVPAAVTLSVLTIAADQGPDLGSLISVKGLHVFPRDPSAANNPYAESVHAPTPFCRPAVKSQSPMLSGVNPDIKSLP
jgi:hypothetical protein